MIDLIDDDGRFTYSKEHSELEYYKCFYDPSNPDSITGEELLRLKEREFWSKENSRIWFYFYRPYNYRNNIAPKKKKWIANIESNIEKLRRDVFFNKLYGISSFILISLYFIYSNSLSDIIIFPIVLYIVFIFLKIQSINKNILLIEKIRLPEKLTSNIFGNEIKTISLSSASGTYYRCVIPDFDVTDGLNEWLDYNNENEKIDSEVKEYIAKNKNDDEVNKYKAEKMKEKFEVNKKYKGLIETLAWLAFKELRNKVAKFAVIESKPNRL